MMKTLLSIACLTILSCQPAVAESLLKKLLRITGISATPSQQKAPGEEMEAGGAIWIADLRTQKVRQLSRASGFRSPIFAPNDQAVLAVKESTLWRLPLDDGPAGKVHQVVGLAKLIGADRDDADRILVLLERDSTALPALLSLKTGTITELAYDAQSSDDRKLLSHLKGWERVYGETRVYPKTQRRESIAGTVEWQDVFLKKGDDAPVNISRCEGDNCGQPSLSSDGTKAVFVRAAP